MFDLHDYVPELHGRDGSPLIEVVRHATVVQVPKWHYQDYLAGLPPFEVFEHRGNVLTSSGLLTMWQLITAAGGTSFANANAYVGVGDSATAASSGQTDLIAATNKLRKQCSAGSPGISVNVVSFQAIFGTAEGNYAWQEFGVFNAAAAGIMLNRAVSSAGTKTSAQQWAAILSITLT